MTTRLCARHSNLSSVSVSVGASVRQRSRPSHASTKPASQSQRADRGGLSESDAPAALAACSASSVGGLGNALNTSRSFARVPSQRCERAAARSKSQAATSSTAARCSVLVAIPVRWTCTAVSSLLTAPHHQWSRRNSASSNSTLVRCAVCESMPSMSAGRSDGSYPASCSSAAQRRTTSSRDSFQLRRSTRRPLDPTQFTKSRQGSNPGLNGPARANSAKRSGRIRGSSRCGGRQASAPTRSPRRASSPSANPRSMATCGKTTTTLVPASMSPASESRKRSGPGRLRTVSGRLTCPSAEAHGAPRGSRRVGYPTRR